MLSEFAIRQNTRVGRNGLKRNAQNRGLAGQPQLPNLNNPRAAAGQNTPLSQAQMNEAAQMRAQAKQVYNQTLNQGNPSPAATVTPQGKAAQKHAQQQHKKRLDEQDLRDKYANSNLPLVAPAVNYVSNRVIDRFGANENAVTGTLAGLTLAPIAAGAAIYTNQKNKKAEKEKQVQAQWHRDKVAEIMAKRNLLLEQRQAQAQQPEQELQPRLGYNHFNSSAKQANFFFGRPKPQGVDLRKAAAIAVGGYGLLSGLNKKRNDDALKINKLKDKEERAAALDYYNSAQYNIDNVISNVPTALGLSNIVPETLAHPLIAPTPNTEKEKRDNKPRWTNYRTQAAYSKPKLKQSADFFLPFIAPVIGIAGAGYGLYRRKKEAAKKDEILEAEKLAALDRIQDPELRAGLLSKARGQVIDDGSRAQLVDAALDGDYKTALGVGLKKINFDNK